MDKKLIIYIKLIIISIVFVSSVFYLNFVTYASDLNSIDQNVSNVKNSTITVTLDNEKDTQINSVCVLNDEGSYEYYFWVNDILNALANVNFIPNNSSLFLQVSEDFKEDSLDSMVEAVDQFFGNEKFSISESVNQNGNFYRQCVLYQNLNNTGLPHYCLSDKGTVQNVNVYFVEENKIDFKYISSFEKKLNLSTNAVFKDSKKALEIMIEERGYPNVTVIDADKMKFEYANNKIVKFSQKQFEKLVNLEAKPFAVTNLNNNKFPEGANVVSWVLEDLFLSPVIWYDIYYGVNLNVIVNNDKEDYTILDLHDEYENSANNNQNKNINKKPSLIKPLLYLVFLILFGYYLFWSIIKYILKNKKSKKNNMKKSYYRGFREYIDMDDYNNADYYYNDNDLNINADNKRFDTEGYEDVKFREIE